jgi:hypothetical protein
MNKLQEFFLVLFILVMALGGVAKAQVMESSSYQIQSDSINFGGGLLSSSNYTLESTAGEVGTGESDSASYVLKAGYQQMNEVYISLSGVTDVTMSPAIPGVSGGEANGSTTVTVTTDSTAGYQLTILSSATPAMQSSLDTISDYAPAGAPPDYTFNYGASDALFGYTPEGIDIVARFLDNGSNTCNTGSSETPLRCWDGLSTSAEAVASGSGPNHPNGATTTVNFRVGIGGSVGQTEGVYYATTTLTVLAL